MPRRNGPLPPLVLVLGTPGTAGVSPRDERPATDSAHARLAAWLADVTVEANVGDARGLAG